MNKSELIDAIALSADISKAAAGRSLEATVDSITEALQAGDQVALVGFGTFQVKDRAARSGRNPRPARRFKLKLLKCLALKQVKR